MGSLIGELLAMAVVVILFSGIFTYVLTLPPPEDTTYSDFEYESPKVIQNGTSYLVYANITNSGGQTLYDHATGIYIFVNDELYDNREFSIHESYTSLGSEWKVGGVWGYPINVGNKSQSENASIRAMVIDKSTNTIVFNQYITGIPNSSPIIMDKYTDPRVGIISDLAYFCVNITDANDDIVDAYVDMTGINDRMGGQDRITLRYQSSFLWKSNNGVTVTPDWARVGANEVTIVVTDAAGHVVTSRMILQARLPDSSNETGYEPPNIIYSKNDGFNIFKKTEWERDNFLATRGEKFNYTFVLDSDDTAFIVVSKNLLNTEARNYIEVYDITTKEIIYKSETAFTRYKFTQGFSCYQAFINIDSPLFQTDERYIVNAVLKDNSVPSHSVTVSHEISTRNGGDYPWMQTYVNRTDANASISFWNNNIVEVKITGNYPANTDWYGPAGDIIIRDFTGGTQMHWAPAVPTGSPSYYWNNGPVSNVVKIDSNTYGFAINLTAVKSGDAWVAGRNQAYSLEYDMFTLKDTSGKYFQYQLSSIIYISSPTFSGGIAAGFVEGVSPQNGGGGQYYEGNVDWIQSSSMLYYVNDNSWTPPIPIDQDFWNAHRPQTLLCAGGDLNGDGQSREVISYYASTTPHNYQTDNNFANTNDPTSWSRLNLNVFNGETWSVTQLRALNSNTEIKSLALVNIDQDNDLDVIYGMKNSSVYIGRNNGDNPSSWVWTCVHMDNIFTTSKSVVALTGAYLGAGAISNNTTRGSSIIVGCNDGTAYVLRNTDGNGNWNAPWAALTGTNRAKSISLPSGTLRVSSMAMGDLDNDDRWDLAIMRTSSTTGGRLSICYNNDLVKASPSSSDDSRIVNNMLFPDKTNMTIGKYLGRDSYPDIAIMSLGNGIYFLNHTYSGGVHSYTFVSATKLTEGQFNTPATTTRVAQLSCMISGDIDGDGLDDLIVGTMRNPWGEVINGTTYYNRMSKGAIFVVVNGNASPNGWQKYLVDDPGTPIRCLALMQ